MSLPEYATRLADLARAQEWGPRETFTVNGRPLRLARSGEAPNYYIDWPDEGIYRQAYVFADVPPRKAVQQ